MAQPGDVSVTYSSFRRKLESIERFNRANTWTLACAGVTAKDSHVLPSDIDTYPWILIPYPWILIPYPQTGPTPGNQGNGSVRSKGSKARIMPDSLKETSTKKSSVNGSNGSNS